jgi:hypothetical protein
VTYIQTDRHSHPIRPFRSKIYSFTYVIDQPFKNLLITCCYYSKGKSHAGNVDKNELFLTYRCLQVLGQHCDVKARRFVLTALLTLAALVVTASFFLIRGRADDDFPQAVNTGIIVACIISNVTLCLGGEEFFRHALSMSQKSVECWSRLRRGCDRISHSEAAFYKSCRRISMHFGGLFPLKNLAAPLVFFGNFIGKTLIDLLLTFR